jgi:hypothetical protein
MNQRTLKNAISYTIKLGGWKAATFMERQHPCWHDVPCAVRMKRKMPAGVPAFQL